MNCTDRRPLTSDAPVPLPPMQEHFVRRNGKTFAGTHLILEFIGAEGLDDLERIDRALREAAEASGASLLHIHTHKFTPQGVTGVAVLAESHISVHTWPEKGYGAFDVFMCGDADPHAAVDSLRSEFGPAQVQIVEHLRGEGIADAA